MGVRKMPRAKIVFIAFAKEDEGIRNLVSGQKVIRNWSWATSPLHRFALGTTSH